MDTPVTPPEIYAEVIVDTFVNVHGGLERSSAWLYFAALGAEYPLTSDFSLHGELWLTDNRSISELVGDEQGISNIESSDAGVHIGTLAVGYETEALSVLLGVFDINNYFDVIDSANLFVHSAFGMGSVFGISGPNGPSTYPQPGLTGKISYQSGHHTFQFAIADGEPGDPPFYHHRPSAEEKRINLMIVSEYSYQRDNTNLLLGWWGYNDDSVVLNRAKRDGSNNSGIYLRGEYTISHIQSDKDVILFGRIGSGASAYNFFDEFYSVGITVTGDSTGVNAEQFGLAIAHARTSEHTLPYTAEDETAVEFTYAKRFDNGLKIQPSFQWISSPGASQSTSDAVVIGLRFNWVYN